MFFCKGDVNLKRSLIQLREKEDNEIVGISSQSIDRPITYVQFDKTKQVGHGRKHVKDELHSKSEGNVHVYNSNRYAELIKELCSVKVEIHTIDERVPYEIPVFYSLDHEKYTIATMNKRIRIIKEKLIKSDKESLAVDWRNVGRDIDEASIRCREEYGKYR